MRPGVGLFFTLLLCQLVGCQWTPPSDATMQASTRPYRAMFDREDRSEAIAEYAAARTVLIFDAEQIARVMGWDRASDAPRDETVVLNLSCGVILSEGGLVLATAHGTTARNLLVALPGWHGTEPLQLREAKVLWRREKEAAVGDLAVLQIELVTGDPPLAFLDPSVLKTPPPRPGQVVLTSGAGSGEKEMELSLKHAAGPVLSVNAVEGLGHEVEVDAPGRPGFSGGPVFAEDGTFAGVSIGYIWQRRLGLRGIMPVVRMPSKLTVSRPSWDLLAPVLGGDRASASPVEAQ